MTKEALGSGTTLSPDEEAWTFFSDFFCDMEGLILRIPFLELPSNSQNGLPADFIYDLHIQFIIFSNKNIKKPMVELKLVRELL